MCNTKSSSVTWPHTKPADLLYRYNSWRSTHNKTNWPSVQEGHHTPYQLRLAFSTVINQRPSVQVYHKKVTIYKASWPSVQVYHKKVTIYKTSWPSVHLGYHIQSQLTFSTFRLPYTKPADLQYRYNTKRSPYTKPADLQHRYNTRRSPYTKPFNLQYMKVTIHKASWPSVQL